MATTQGNGPANGSLDELLGVLSHDYRRQILLALSESGAGADADDAVDPAAAVDADDEPATVRVKLRHVHLPKLADAGLVRWNRDERSVSRGPRFEAVEPLVDAVSECESHLC